ncbi:GntR family transcriptional regulator [Streptomyces naganishii]|uniref:GntR family transcriptional regulator n=1 Tax=Streptomyces naganishii JCM 4654 TaxID=1306179 RepID=A0A918Y4W2_9ACTN|nr:GntR family transcriptional regulator [Streptomyces naganishii]GHD90704.1 GntR family transcriptional regulator [Streptomyces naganishii JCM 4654]
MKQGAQDSTGTGTREDGTGRAAAAAARVPRQPGPGDRGRGRNDSPGAQAVGGEPTRGEHTHAEPPLPRPRPVVQRSSVRGQILDALRTALLAGELKPGEVYSGPALGERFGVSATPVREAMQQLALEGAVEVVPNRGFRVVERGARELAELAEVRALIEVPVVLRLARTLPAERWDELREPAEATVRAAASGCRATYAESDRAFHRALLSLAGNTQLADIAEDLHRRAQWPLTAATTRPDLLADATAHTTLLDALVAGDLPLTAHLLHQHLTPAPRTP